MVQHVHSFRGTYSRDMARIAYSEQSKERVDCEGWHVARLEAGAQRRVERMAGEGGRGQPERNHTEASTDRHDVELIECLASLTLEELCIARGAAVE